MTNETKNPRQIAEHIFKTRLWSPSVYGTLKNCPFAYQQLYLKGIRVKAREHPGTKIGLAIHRTMEKMSSLDYLPTAKEIQDTLYKNARALGLTEDDVEPHRLAVQDIIQKTIQYLRNNEYRTILTEVELRKNNIRGQVDRIIISDTHIFIIDHKTARRVPSVLPDYYREQLYWYAWLALENLYKLDSSIKDKKEDMKAMVGIHYTRAREILWDNRELDYQFLSNFIQEKISHILDILEEQIKKHGQNGDWDARINNLCDYCDVRFMCSTYKEMHPGISIEVKLREEYEIKKGGVYEPESKEYQEPDQETPER